MKWWLVVATLVAAMAVTARARAQEQVGHKQLGTLGLLAGSQPAPGLYLVDQFAYYRSTTIVDRYGYPLPIGLEVNAPADAVGIAVVFEIPSIATYVNLAAGLPIVSLHASAQRPDVRVDSTGIGDLYVQPLKLGWRPGPVDLVVSYGFYAPTASFDPEGSIGGGRSQWTHEVSAGGTVRFGPDGRMNFSTLASFDAYGDRLGTDVRRGDTIALQGGLGVTIGWFNTGVAGYALWQIGEYEGGALAAALRGARDRTYGLGPEIDLTVAPLRSLFTLRYVHDVASLTRPMGGLLVVGWSGVVWPVR